MRYDHPIAPSSPPPSAPGSSGRPAGFWLAALLFAYYLLVLGGHHYSVDGIVMFQGAKSLVFQGSLSLDPPVVWGSARHGKAVGLGLILAYTPLLLLWWPVFAWAPRLRAVPYEPGLAHNPALYANLPYLLCSWLNGAITAATGWLVFRLAREVGLSRGWAIAAGLAYGLASPAAAYARMDFAQPLAGLALAATALCLLRSRGERTVPWLAGAGIAFACAVLTRVELAVLAPFAGAWMLIARHRGDVRTTLRRAFALAIPMVAGVVLVLAVNHAVTGKLLNPPRALGALFELSPRTLVGVGGLLASPARGIIYYFPLALLVIPGLAVLWRTSRPAAALLAGFIAVPFALYSSFVFWWGGGWTWGPRLIVPLLPFAAVAAAVWAGQRTSPTRRAIFVALAVLGAVASLNATLWDFFEYARWLHVEVGQRDIPATQFHVWSSPLVSGWINPPGRALDLFWIRLLDAEQVRRYGVLVLGSGRGDLATLTWVGRAAAVLVMLGLAGMMTLAAVRLRRLAR